MLQGSVIIHLLVALSFHLNNHFSILAKAGQQNQNSQ